MLEVLILIKPEYGFQVGYSLIFLILIRCFVLLCLDPLGLAERIPQHEGQDSGVHNDTPVFHFPGNNGMLRFPLAFPLLFVVFLLRFPSTNHATCVAGWSQCRRSATSCRRRCACGGSEIHLQAQSFERERDGYVVCTCYYNGNASWCDGMNRAQYDNYNDENRAKSFGNSNLDTQNMQSLFVTIYMHNDQKLTNK